MPLDFDREQRAAEFVPKGPPLPQSIFKMTVCLAYALGEDIAYAVRLGTEKAREDAPNFEPVYDAALLDL
jgi:hypothetical protein